MSLSIYPFNGKYFTVGDGPPPIKKDVTETNLPTNTEKVEVKGDGFEKQDSNIELTTDQINGKPVFTMTNDGGIVELLKEFNEMKDVVGSEGLKKLLNEEMDVAGEAMSKGMIGVGGIAGALYKYGNGAVNTTNGFNAHKDLHPGWNGFSGPGHKPGMNGFGKIPPEKQTYSENKGAFHKAGLINVDYDPLKEVVFPSKDNEAIMPSVKEFENLPAPDDVFKQSIPEYNPYNDIKEFPGMNRGMTVNLPGKTYIQGSSSIPKNITMFE